MKILMGLFLMINLIHASTIDFEGTQAYNIMYVGTYNEYGKQGAKCLTNGFLNKLYRNGNIDRHGNKLKELPNKEADKLVDWMLENMEECGYDSSQLRAYFNR